MYRLLRSLPVLAVMMLTAFVAEASCVTPEPPRVIPAGSTATYEDMLDAHRLVRAFDADVHSFTLCLELELAELVADQRLEEDMKNDLRSLYARRHDAAVEQAEYVAERFNEQLRIFKARGE
jgi:hypothetical protein